MTADVHHTSREVEPGSPRPLVPELPGIVGGLEGDLRRSIFPEAAWKERSLWPEARAKDARLTVMQAQVHALAERREERGLWLETGVRDATIISGQAE